MTGWRKQRLTRNKDHGDLGINEPGSSKPRVSASSILRNLSNKGTENTIKRTLSTDSERGHARRVVARLGLSSDTKENNGGAPHL